MLKFITKEGKTKFILLDESDCPIGLTEEELEEYELAKSSNRLHKIDKQKDRWSLTKEIIDTINNEYQQRYQKKIGKE